jgi:hypothetical protein
MLLSIFVVIFVKSPMEIYMGVVIISYSRLDLKPGLLYITFNIICALNLLFYI